jgi:DNA topoisomerase-1
MDAWLLDEKRRLHICGNSPNCPGIQVEEGAFKIKGYDGPSIPCDKCSKPMQLKTGRFGKYFGCTGWPACSNTRKLMRNGQAAPPKIPPVAMPELKCVKADDHFVLRDGGNGLFLSASTYPKVRETRNPTVEDLQRHRAALPEKYLYLADAPAKDPKGRPAIVRFARKEREHYIASENAEGKPSGWSARFVDGAWKAD